MTTFRQQQLTIAQIDWLVQRDRAFHLVARHKNAAAIANSPEVNRDLHYAEHFGPGGIRNHRPFTVDWDEETLEAVLEEAEADE